MAKTLIYIDAGHGGSDSGAVGYITEKNIALSISRYCDEYLRSKGIATLMARNTDIYKSLDSRVKEANKAKATYYVSIHLNAGRGDGVETYHTVYRGVGEDLAENIFSEIVKIGQNDDRGVKTRRSVDGSDYYYVIKYTNMPATIVECAFVDHSQDYKIVDTASEQKAMGIAIAKGIIATLKEQGLYKDEELRYKSHVQDYGWEKDFCKPGETSGTVGQAKRMEAIIIDAPSDWDIKYQVHVQDYDDMPVKSDGEVAGTVGKAKRMEAIKIMANKPIMYRVHVQDIGWMPWVTNGEWAGTKGKAKRLEAIEIKEAVSSTSR